MRCTEEERDTFRRDLSDSDLGRDQLIRKAWDVRDAAVRRKNAGEVEMSRERIGILQVCLWRETSDGGRRGYLYGNGLTDWHCSFSCDMF